MMPETMTSFRVVAGLQAVVAISSGVSTGESFHGSLRRMTPLVRSPPSRVETRLTASLMSLNLEQKGGYEDEAQCDIHLSPSPLLKHYLTLG